MLAHHQIHSDRRGVRAVGHRGRHPGRAGRGGDHSAGTAAGHQPVLDHPDGDLRDVEHLPPDDPGRRTLGPQLRPAAGAGARIVHHHLIRRADLPQRAALPPRLPAGLAARPAAQRLGRRLVQPVARRRLGGVPRGGGQLPPQLRDLRVLLGDPRLQRHHQSRQLLVGRRGHGPILHTPPGLTRSRHAGEDLNSHDREGRISFSRFYGRRMRRLLPAAALVLIFTVVVARLVLPGTQAQSIVKDVFYAAIYGINYRLAFEGVQYQNATAPPSPLQHFWSLAVEEQFYIVWPLLIALCLLVGRRKHYGKLMVAAIVVISVGTLLASILQTPSDPSLSYFSIHTRAWELGAGALLALVAHHLVMPQWIRATLAWAGLAAIVATALLYTDETLYPGWAAIVPGGRLRGCARRRHAGHGALASAAAGPRVHAVHGQGLLRLVPLALAAADPPAGMGRPGVRLGIQPRDRLPGLLGRGPHLLPRECRGAAQPLPPRMAGGGVGHVRGRGRRGARRPGLAAQPRRHGSGP